MNLRISVVALAAALSAVSPAVAGQLTIYSPWTEENLNDLQEELNRRNMDIQLSFFRSASVELNTLFTTEQAAGIQKADYIMIDPDILDIYKEKGYLHKHTPAGVEKFLPDAVDPDGYWFSLEFSPMFIIYNENKLSGGNIPKKWLDLADPRYKNQIGMADPRTSTAVQLPLTYWTQNLKDKSGEPPYGWNFVEKLAANEPVLTTGHTQLGDLVITGEVSAAVLMLAPVLDRMRAGEPVAISLPEEGAPVIIVAGAIVENAPNREDAIKLHDFLASKEGQEFIVEKVGTTVGHTEVEQVLPDGSNMRDINLVRMKITPEQRESNATRFFEILEK